MSSVTAEAPADAARTPPVFALLLRLLAHNWTWGALVLNLPNGEVHRLNGSIPGPQAIMNVREFRLPGPFLANAAMRCFGGPPGAPNAIMWLDIADAPAEVPATTRIR